mgnify:CR=1 FL=1
MNYSEDTIRDTETMNYLNRDNQQIDFSLEWNRDNSPESTELHRDELMDIIFDLTSSMNTGTDWEINWNKNETFISGELLNLEDDTEIEFPSLSQIQGKILQYQISGLFGIQLETS